MLFDLFGARRGGDAGWHDERHIAGGFAQGFQDDGARLLQHHAQGAGFGCFQFIDKAKQDATHGVTTGPSFQGCRDILAGDRLAIVEGQTRAQLESPGFAVFAGAVTLHHLRLDLALAVLREQGVVNHVAMVARHIGRGPNGIEHRQIGVGHEAKHLVGRHGVLRHGCCGQQQDSTAQHQCFQKSSSHQLPFFFASYISSSI